MHRIIDLDESTPLVAIQFNCSNPDVVPSIMRRISNEREEEKVERKKIKKGVQVISPTPNTSLLIFVKQLEETGYELVDIDYQERPNSNVKNKKYHMMKFLFSRHECAKPSKEFQKYSDIVYSELDKICRQALWRVRGYINPFYKKGEEVKEKNFISINMEVRKPLLSQYGHRIKKWGKDDKGRKIGKGPIPLSPDFYLSAQYGKIRLIEVSKALVRRALLRKI